MGSTLLPRTSMEFTHIVSGRLTLTVIIRQFREITGINTYKNCINKIDDGYIDKLIDRWRDDEMDR